MTDKKILLIGDDISVDKILQSILQEEYQCEVKINYPPDCDNNYVQDYNPTVIIASGRRYGDFVNDLKSDLRSKDIPIIMMSYSYPGEYFLNIAADDFMSKPLNLTILLEKVKNYLY